MTEIVNTDICVIGAGSGGLSVAAGAAQMGARTVLIEKAKMGGDCLNHGCVPSKSLLAAARAADAIRRSGRFGVNGHELDVDFARVHDHVHGVIGAIAPHDSQERFEGLGVQVIRESGFFIGPYEIAAGSHRIRAKRFVVATGSSPLVPDIPGLADVPYSTNETIFDNTERPDHLLIIGGGPIALEMAQAHRLLGAQVTVLQRSRILRKDDPELIEVVRRRLHADGIELLEGISIHKLERAHNGIAIVIEQDGAQRRIRGTHLLVAAGRRPNINGLGLDSAGIDYGERGIAVDRRLRTTNKRVFAIGDVIGGHQFTHMAGYHAGIVIRNALFRLPAKIDERAVPRITFTQPEIAHVGMSEPEARAAHGNIRVLRSSFSANDRAKTERDTDGMVKVFVTNRGRVLGASMVGPHAGELLLPWSLAITEKISIGKIANAIVPYPTLSEVSKRAAGSYYTDSLFSERTRKVVRALLSLG